MADIRIAHWTRLGSAIRDARTGREWSQHELATRANVSRSWVAKVEAGHRSAELEQPLRLLQALGLTLTLHDSRAKSVHADAPEPTDRAEVLEAVTAKIAAERAQTAERRRTSWASTKRAAASVRQESLPGGSE